MTSSHPSARLKPIGFSDLEGWAGDDHGAAFSAFRLSAEKILASPPSTKGLGLSGDALVGPAEAALRQGSGTDADTARRFFEHWFVPHRIRPAEGGGFVTGYFEPEVEGSRHRSERFPTPLYARPIGLAEIPSGADRGSVPKDVTWALATPDGLAEMPDRGAIQAGALDGRGLELVYVKSLVEAFFIHVQGSARIRLAEGGSMRVGFAGKTGHPYFPVGKVLIERGLFQPHEVTADVLRHWLDTHPEDVPEVLARNRSFIFFAEIATTDPDLGPVAAAGVQLTPGRSLAVDRNLMTFHMPIWLSLDIPLDGISRGTAVERLMIAQDTGSAIVGPARGDIFFGTGEAAWRQAAPVRHAADFTVLVPRDAVEGAGRRGT
ncbi:Membrane-bound lytic murein transglycosylase A precursor [Hartmannibacter diazotrophicus]|uniref:peptidoglycan lytic exotransglycosylase n=1 Tax=Hartmannibacter diazotrophicus TaxID=1482074 RepID=A0A2C9D051_9HYPH|nr:MltA domain-containing protein [Hartmannibacter diazotrophicus]SON53548.1 Membrane-bound lytic murein transglycosylase A precursor [Hartmannibacter diazotrophicus]